MGLWEADLEDAMLLSPTSVRSRPPVVVLENVADLEAVIGITSVVLLHREYDWYGGFCDPLTHCGKSPSQ